tara:strand:+ start:137 stop:661 length:525 start_codon:yes stop_codon:yes gene_type:complete
MTKPFNIHDWQAKRRLAENDEYQKRQDRLTPGKNPGEFYDKDSVFAKLKDDPNFLKKPKIKDTTSGGGVNEHHGDEDFPGKDLSAWDLLDKLKKQPDLYDKVEDFMKSMDSEPSKANDSMWTQTSTADTSTDTVEPEVEKEKPNWRNYRENATGEGASMTGGPGMGHFGKKKNK